VLGKQHRIIADQRLNLRVKPLGGLRCRCLGGRWRRGRRGRRGRQLVFVGPAAAAAGEKAAAAAAVTPQTLLVSTRKVLMWNKEKSYKCQMVKFLTKAAAAAAVTPPALLGSARKILMRNKAKSWGPRLRMRRRLMRVRRIV
jgi:hypothetical protein